MLAILNMRGQDLIQIKPEGWFGLDMKRTKKLITLT